MTSVMIEVAHPMSHSLIVTEPATWGVSGVSSLMCGCGSHVERTPFQSWICTDSNQQISTKGSHGTYYPPDWQIQLDVARP